MDRWFGFGFGGLLRGHRQVGGEDVQRAAQGGLCGQEIVAQDGFETRERARAAGGKGVINGVEQPVDEAVGLGNQAAAQRGEGGEIHGPSIGTGSRVLRKCLWNSLRALILLGVRQGNWLRKWCVYGGVGELGRPDPSPPHDWGGDRSAFGEREFCQTALPVPSPFMGRVKVGLLSLSACGRLCASGLPGRRRRRGCRSRRRPCRG